MIDPQHGVDEPWWSEYWFQQTQRARFDPVLAAAAAHGFVLSTRELERLGVSRAHARTRVAHGQWTPVGHGFVAPQSAPTPRHLAALQATAAGRRRPDDAISGVSAAVLYALPLFTSPDRPRLTLRDESLGRARPSAAGCFTGWLDHSEITSWYGAAVTIPSRTLVDLARHDRFDGIMAADVALQLGLVTDDEIVAALDRARGWPGVRQARDVLALADARAESPLESVTRLRLHDDGFPPPEPQFWIGKYRVDFCWPEFRLVLEVDGRLKYSGAGGPDTLWDEKQREHVVHRSGYRVERIIARDVYRGWPETSAYLRPLLQLPRRVG